MQLCNGERRKEREKRGIKKSEIQLPWNKAVPRSPVWGSAESLSAVFELQAKMALGSSRDSGRGYISTGRSCRPACGVRTVKEVSRVLVFTTREKERKFLEALLSLPPLEIGRTFPIFTIRFKFDIGFLYWSFCNSLYHGPENEVGDTAHALFFCCFFLWAQNPKWSSLYCCVSPLYWLWPLLCPRPSLRSASLRSVSIPRVLPGSLLFKCMFQIESG